MVCQTVASLFGLWILSGDSYSALESMLLEIPRGALRTPPNSRIHSHSRVLHNHCEVMGWIAQRSTERFLCEDRRSIFVSYQSSVFAKIFELTSMRPPAGSSAFFRGDSDGGVAASTHATSFSACSGES